MIFDDPEGLFRYITEPYSGVCNYLRKQFAPTGSKLFLLRVSSILEAIHYFL